MSARTRPGFSEEWVSRHVADLLSLSPLQIRVGYACTFLNPVTLRQFGSIIDAGCGGAYLRQYLDQQRWTGRYTGCDASPHSLASARERFPAASFIRSDLTALPFAADAAELLYARDSVIHCVAPLEALAEVYRVGGHLLLRVRVADIQNTFTAHYNDADMVHQWFGLDWLLHALAQLTPAPRRIRYRVQNRTPRTYDRDRFVEPAPFTQYAAADLLITKGSGATRETEVIENASGGALGALRRLIERRNYAASSA